MLYLEYKKKNLPAELHIYTQGGHGFGMRRESHPINDWPQRVAEWMVAMGICAEAVVRFGPAAALIKSVDAGTAEGIISFMPLAHLRTVPIFRSFDEAKAREFYVDWLGFTVDWEHRFESSAPLYMQVSRAGIVFHLSEHHGDGSPGSHVRVAITGVREFHSELTAKQYKHNRPQLQRPAWGGTEFEVIDPVNNRITFSEPDAPDALPKSGNELIQ
jgi:catechol 2,3-dioxygenase-like lactoylglutathione lyase family enzyme